MARSVRLYAILLAGLMVLSAIMMFVPTAVAQAGNISVKPTLTISPMNPQSREVVVTPSSIGSASFTGVVTVTKPPAVGVVQVQLDGSCSTGWTTVVSPQTIPFTAPNEVQITVTVVVPQATPTAAIGRVQVTGIATYPGGSETAVSSATVTIIQYYRLTPQSQQPFITMGPGTQAMLQIDLYNRGNGLDTISIDFINLKELKREDWMVTPSTWSVDNVPMDEYDTIKITVRPKKPWGFSYKHGEITYIEVLVVSDNANIQGLVVQKKFLFAIMVDGFYVPGYDITFVIMAFGIIAAAMAYRKSKIKRR